MADKFTPYGLTALPSAIEDRDPNGVYFIRTATGFKIVCIANDPNRTPVELDYQDLSDLVPYTGADKPIDFNTQNLTLGGYTNKLASYFERINLASNSTGSGNFKLLTNVAAAEMGNASGQTADIIITLPITTSTFWQAEIDILRQGYRATLNIGGSYTDDLFRFVNGVYGAIDDILEVKFGRIGDNTVIIIKRSNPTIHRLQVNISKFYYHHSNSADLYNDKSKYKVEYIDEGDLEGFTLNGVVENSEFIRDSYLWNKGDFTQTNVDNWNTAFDWGDFRDYGLGNTQAKTINDLGGENNDWNTLPHTLNAFVYGSNTSLNYPGAANEYPIGLKIGYNENIGATILVGRGNIPELRFRPDNNNNTFPWARVWHDVNLPNPATQTWVNEQGFLTEETDPTVPSHVKAITTGDINDWNAKGVQLTADQPSAKIHLRDSAGNIISTLDVGFLNNEGTTIVFNNVTDEIELRNDDDELLSSFPASALMTGVGFGLNLTGSTLELTDSTNNAIDSVTLTIANIQGLQTALEGKALKTTQITAGTGLTGGGNLGSDRTIGLSTSTQSDIEKGVTAHGWGNHADAGYVDLISPQHIDGPKTFINIGLKLQGLVHVPQANGDALIYHLEYPGGRNGLHITSNKDSNLKSMYLDISDLQITGTDLRVQFLEQSAKVQGERNLEGEAVNYLGWKKVFDITEHQIDLTANDTPITIPLSSGNLPILAWDNGQAFMQGTHWDIIWEEIGPGQAYRKFSLKDTYGRHVLSTTEIRRTRTGGEWQLRLAVDIDLTIPEGAKLVIW